MKRTIIIIITFLTVISGFVSCLGPVKPADTDDNNTKESTVDSSGSKSKKIPDGSPLDGIVFDYRPLDEFVQSITTEQYFDKVYGVVDDPPVGFFSEKYDNAKLGEFYINTYNEDFINRKDRLPLICYIVRHIEIPKDEFVRFNEAAKEKRNDMPVMIYSDEEIEYIFGEYDDETVMKHLKAPTAFYHDRKLFTIYDLLKLDDGILKEFYEAGGLEKFLDGFEGIVNGIKDFYREKYAKEFAEDEYFLWGTMYTYGSLYDSAESLKERCTGTAHETEPPVDPESIITGNVVFDGIVFDYRPLDDITAFSSTKKLFDLIYLGITEGGAGPDFPEEYMAKFREISEKWEQDKRYFENDRLPLMYYIIKETGISRDEFVRINEEYKVKKLDDLSIGYPVYTDEEIEYFFGDYDKETAMKHLKAPTAFYSDGRLYTIYDLDGLDDSELKSVAGKGNIDEYLIFMKKFVAASKEYYAAKHADSYYLPQVMSGYDRTIDIIDSLCTRCGL